MSQMRTLKPKTTLSEYAQLWSLFFLIIYTPLPLASNRPWALALLSIFVVLLSVWVIWQPTLRLDLSAWKYAKLPLSLLGVWVVLLALQLMPLSEFAQGLGVFSGNTLSIDPYSTRLYLAKACVLAAAFWLVMTLIDSQARMESLSRAVVFSGLLQALIGVVLMASGTTFQVFFVTMDDARAHGTFVSPNQYAGYLEMTLAMGIGLMIAKLDGGSAANWRHRIHGWLSVIISGKAMLRLGLIIMVVGLVASRSRMGNAAFFASLLVTGLLAVIFSKHATRTTVVFIASLVVLDVVIIGGMVGVEKVVQRIENTNLKMQQESQINSVVSSSDAVKPLQVNNGEQSLESRGEVAVPSLQIVRDFPWLGTGGGTFFLAFPHVKSVELLGYYDHPHNDYVEFASETGLTGLFLLAVFVLHSLWKSLKLLMRSRDQFARGMAFASVMGGTSLLIHATVDFNFQNPTNAMLFLILLAIPYLMDSFKRKTIPQ